MVGRALGRPCVVGCGDGTLASLAGEVVTVDGACGVVYRGALPVETPSELDDPHLMQIARWAAE
ncbi:MAG: pyruvate, phosphate dikinase, partial [Rhizobacter sp.]|nr:pyruvate, phosphate dikinase [Rhizobacter sp.]